MTERSPCLWTQLPQHGRSPCDRHKHACCTHQGSVYVLGGRHTRSLRDLWRYSVVRNEWAELDCSSEAAPEELEEHSMVAHQGLLFVFGGALDSAYAERRCPLWLFDTGQQKWSTVPAKISCQQPTNRKAHSAVVLDSAMLVYGGLVDMRGSSQEFWKLDLDTLAWSRLDGPQQGSPGPRHGHSAAAHQGCMYVFGGLRGLREQRELWRWNGRTWTLIRTRSGPPRLVGHSAAVYRDSMLLFGGGESQSRPGNSLWRFSFSALSWEQMSTLAGAAPPPRMHHCAVGVGPGYRGAAGTPRGSSEPPAELPEHKARPFKNRCFPAPLTFLGSEVAIELETFGPDGRDGDGEDAGTRGRDGLSGKDTRRLVNCLTFENKAFSQQWSCEEEEDEDGEGGVAQHLPDVLLVLGGKPLGGRAPVSVWQMTLADT